MKNFLLERKAKQLYDEAIAGYKSEYPNVILGKETWDKTPEQEKELWRCIAWGNFKIRFWHKVKHILTWIFVYICLMELIALQIVLILLSTLGGKFYLSINFEIVKILWELIQKNWK